MDNKAAMEIVHAIRDQSDEITQAIHLAAQLISAAILLAGGIIKSDDDVIAQCSAVGMAKEMAKRLR